MNPSDRRRGPLRAFYFAYYAYVGVQLVYFPAYLRGLGFSGTALGLALSGAQLVSGPAALLWGMRADRTLAPARTLRLCALGACAPLALLPWARVPPAVFALLLVQALFGAALVPLCDSICIEWSAAQPGRSYSRVRLFGSLGFVASAQGLGLWLSARGAGLSDVLVPATMLSCLVGVAAAAWKLSRGGPERTTPSARPVSADVPPSLWTLLRRPQLALLLAACGLHWLACAPYNLMFGVLIRDAGFPPSLAGAAAGLGVLAEVLALFSLPLLPSRIPMRSLFAASFLFSAVRWALLSQAQSPWALVFLQLLHGLTFGLWWGITIRAMGTLIPAELRSRGQAAFSSIVFFGGNLLGTLLCGAGYDLLGGSRPLFLAAAVLELVPLLLVLWIKISAEPAPWPLPVGSSRSGGCEAQALSPP